MRLANAPKRPLFIKMLRKSLHTVKVTIFVQLGQSAAGGEQSSKRSPSRDRRPVPTRPVPSPTYLRLKTDGRSSTRLEKAIFPLHCSIFCCQTSTYRAYLTQRNVTITKPNPKEDNLTYLTLLYVVHDINVMKY